MLTVILPVDGLPAIYAGTTGGGQVSTYSKGADRQPYVVIDGKLITGQILAA